MSEAPELDVELGEEPVGREHEFADKIAAMMKQSVETTYPPTMRPARRDAHPKAHGVVKAEFRVHDDVPEHLAHGVFVPGKTYAAWIRFSNADGDPDRADSKGGAHGMAIKLMGVPGDKILVEEKDAQTQDFLMIDHPVFIIDTADRYLKFLSRSASSNAVVKLFALFALGLHGVKIARVISTRTIASALETRYWSTTSYRLGMGRTRTAIKFSARPHVAGHTAIPGTPSDNFLRDDLVAKLAAGPAVFDFLVQARAPGAMNVESASGEWLESDAPFHAVATITIPKQAFTSGAQVTFGENLSFTPWHALPAHRPLGSINRVRRVVYEQVSRLRHSLNQAPRREPTGDESF